MQIMQSYAAFNLALKTPAHRPTRPNPGPCVGGTTDVVLYMQRTADQGNQSNRLPPVQHINGRETLG